MIKLTHLTLRFEDKLVLDDFSLTLPERGIWCLMGPSGCGKTTLLRTLLGLETPESGAVTGITRGEAAVLFQEDRLLPWLSLRRNLTEVTGCSDEEAAAWLAAVELDAELDALPEQLSGGMRRRVALARALAYPARLLIFDEPFQGMDDALKTRLYPLLRQAAATKPMLLVTHDPEEAAALADQTLLLSGLPLRIEQISHP